jgi:hypothetical protein
MYKIRPLSGLDIVSEDSLATEGFKPLFDKYTYGDYINDSVFFADLMLPNGFQNNKRQMDTVFNSMEYCMEEKFSGVRVSLHIGSNCTRVFGNLKSTRTNWLVEYTDSLPQFRVLFSSPFNGTIIDGVLIYPNNFNIDIQTILNCSWHEGIVEQKRTGFICLYASDIIRYKGKDVTDLPLIKRKELLSIVIRHFHSIYLRSVKYFCKYTVVQLPFSMVKSLLDDFHYRIQGEENLRFPKLTRLFLEQAYSNKRNITGDFRLKVDKSGYYEYIIASGVRGLY